MCDDARAARLPILLPELNEKLPKKLPKHSGAKFHHSSKIRFTKIQTLKHFSRFLFLKSLKISERNEHLRQAPKIPKKAKVLIFFCNFHEKIIYFDCQN